MKKMLLVDGNSMLFRAFYATAYTRLGSSAQTVSTNAVYGFISMLTKAIDLVQPQAMLVAWDSGKKTFRHKEYPEYKGTRKQLPPELIEQFPIVREYLDAAGLCRYEYDNLEADDIIGCLVKQYPDWDINVLTSDRDLLQLIDATTSVWLMKKGITEIVEMDEAAMMEELHLTPDQIPDLKGLMGDASDNIPGLPGVGEKTANRLLQDYGTLENVLAHEEDLKGKLKETVHNFSQQAVFSKWLATIKTDETMPVSLDNMLFNLNKNGALAFFRKYEMNSMIRKAEEGMTVNENPNDHPQHEFDHLDRSKPIAIYAHYRLDTIWPNPFLGLAFSDGSVNTYMTVEGVLADHEVKKWLAGESKKIVYDAKSIFHAADAAGLVINGVDDDFMIAAFLNDSALVSYEKISEKFGWPAAPVASIDDASCLAARQIADKIAQQYHLLIAALDEKGMTELYRDMEIPLSYVLYQMEKSGIKVDLSVLNTIADQTLEIMNSLSEQIFQSIDGTFNINSPKQLAEVLFDKLNLPANKKRSTAVDVLENLQSAHPIVSLLIEYRKYQKLYSTYAQGLKKFIHPDGRIHTVYNQCVTQTGRLSSSDPNLQNISVRNEETREVRKAFVADEGCVLLSCDYSQIELRILAHMADETAMIQAFKVGFDIHTKTAMDVFGVNKEEITSAMRRQAKAVNFGIVYGISDFGLAQQINVSRDTAKKFIEKYLDTYQGIQRFMDETVVFCQLNGYVHTMFNRRREIPEIFDRSYQVREFAKRAAMNAPIQGSAADLIKIAMINIQKEIKKRQLKARMILQVHDELVFNIPKEELDSVRKLVKDEMENVVSLKVPLEVSDAYGPSWYEAK